MTLYIKNMVCDRCKMVVKSELLKFGLHPISVTLGEAETAENLDKAQLQKLQSSLLVYGFELIDDKKSRVIEKIKNLIIELVYDQNNSLKTNLSDFIANNIGHDYSYISNLFSQNEGTTLEQYYILQKIERVKELLVYNELTLNEIALQLNYSSASHLSKQFKKVTGLTISNYKNLKAQKRNSIQNP